jgi:hypothetical protein
MFENKAGTRSLQKNEYDKRKSQRIKLSKSDMLRSNSGTVTPIDTISS